MIHTGFFKMFDSEKNKHHQRVLCIEIRRLSNESLKQFALSIETLIQKSYSLNTLDYKNKKITKYYMMTLRKILYDYAK